jgi:ERG8-type phosphomevalonate kinase
MAASAKAYGKILLFGAYGVLEPGNLGLVVNIDKGTTSTAEQTQPGRIVIDLSNFQISVEGEVEKGKVRFRQSPEEIKFIKKAVELSFEYLNSREQKIRDIKLITKNDPALYMGNQKTGFGSSASATVSAVAAILKLHDITDRDLVFRIARYAHYEAQGSLGSGYDISSACYGSQFFLSENNDLGSFKDYVEGSPDMKWASFDWPINLLPVLVFTGSSASTPDLISKVMEYKKKRPKEYSEFMQEYNKINIALKGALEANYHGRIKFFIEKSWQMRKLLGQRAKAPIEPEKYTRLISQMKDLGAFTAGLVGAGGGDCILALCRSEDDKQELIAFLESRDLTIFKTDIVNKPYELIDNI